MTFALTLLVSSKLLAIMVISEICLSRLQLLQFYNLPAVGVQFSFCLFEGIYDSYLHLAIE